MGGTNQQTLRNHIEKVEKKPQRHSATKSVQL